MRFTARPTRRPSGMSASSVSSAPSGFSPSAVGAAEEGPAPPDEVLPAGGGGGGGEPEVRSTFRGSRGGAPGAMELCRNWSAIAMPRSSPPIVFIAIGMSVQRVPVVVSIFSILSWVSASAFLIVSISAES